MIKKMLLISHPICDVSPMGPQLIDSLVGVVPV